MEILIYAGCLFLMALLLFYISMHLPFNFPSILLICLILVFLITRAFLINGYGLALASLNLILYPAFIFFYQKKGVGAGKDLIRTLKLPGPAPTVLFTFDDGPSAEWTLPALETLEKNKIRAVFFIVGKDAQKNPEIMEKLINSGQEAAVHSYSHKPLILLFTDELKKELDLTTTIIKNAGCENVRFFRPPWGLCNRQIIDMAKERGLATVLWDWSSRDWSGIGAKEIIKNTEEGIAPGRIFLFHDGHKKGASRKATTEALPGIIDILKEKGFGFAGPDDLTAGGNQPSTGETYEI